MDYEKGGTQKDFYDASEVRYVRCPLCDNNKYNEIYKERGSLGIVQCVSCGLVYVNPHLKEPEKIYWGNIDKYFKEARMIFEGKARHHRDQNYIQDLKLIFKYKPSGNFLDVGTNMGFFLRNAKDWDWSLFGVEPSPALSALARRYFGLNVKTAFLEDAGFKNGFFDVVSMTDVFEHMPEPDKILKEVQRILKHDGILYIKVPNAYFNLFKLYIAKLSGRLNNHDIFNSYEHVVHYSDKTLRSMLEKYGFKVLRVSIGKPIQLPVWHNYVGYYYQYPSPWWLDPRKHFGRYFLYILSLIEFRLMMNRVGYLASNITAIAKKAY